MRRLRHRISRILHGIIRKGGGAKGAAAAAKHKIIARARMRFCRVRAILRYSAFAR